ncbi:MULTISPECIES: hypothetical protein [Roseomonadaceae]|uniref:Uncharacterized protein n=1 Tax=Falsiroseomonas oleicola TaxID=2801474 RepID=A0ABS6HBJ3_9PROT|nr:hypothetical protein [Roseomonas oleicola]MBU8546084.1 hypothetical protein [Roseomonas oleicola]
MSVLTAEDIMRPALILVAYDNERLAGNQACLAKALDEAYEAARLVFPVVRLSTALWVPELEHSLVGKNVSVGNWSRDDSGPECIVIDQDGWYCGFPEGTNAESVLGTFVGLAAKIVASRLESDDAPITAFHRVVSDSRIILKNCGFNPSAVLAADLPVVLVKMSSVPNIDGEETIKYHLARAEAEAKHLPPNFDYASLVRRQDDDCPF